VLSVIWLQLTLIACYLPNGAAAALVANSGLTSSVYHAEIYTTTLGCCPFNQKFGQFRMKGEWKEHFPKTHFGILGVPREVVLIFRKIGITGKFCSIRPLLLGPVSPRPKIEGQHGCHSAVPVIPKAKSKDLFCR